MHVHQCVIWRQASRKDCKRVDTVSRSTQRMLPPQEEDELPTMKAMPQTSLTAQEELPGSTVPQMS